MCVLTVASDRNSRRGDLGVGEPARGEREDLLLPIGQIAVGRRNGPRRRGGEVREQVARGGGRDHGGPGMHGADRREQELGVGILEQEPARPLTDRARGGLVEVERGEHDDARRVGVRAAARGRLPGRP